MGMPIPNSDSQFGQVLFWVLSLMAGCILLKKVFASTKWFRSSFATNISRQAQKKYSPKEVVAPQTMTPSPALTLSFIGKMNKTLNIPATILFGNPVTRHFIVNSFDFKMENYNLDFPKHECKLKKKGGSKRDRIALEIFKRQFLVSNKNFRGNWYLRSKGSVMVEVIRHKMTKYWYIVHPFSLYRLYWEFFMVIAFIFSLVFLPFRGSFLNSYMARYNCKFKKSQTLIVAGLQLELALNLIFIVDSTGLFFTGCYMPEKAYTELRPRKLLKKRIANYIVDVFANMSIDAFILIFAGIDSYSCLSENICIILQIINVIQFVRLRTYLLYCYSYRKFKIFSFIQTRFLLLFFIYFLILHWTVYFVLIIPEIVNGEKLFQDVDEKPISWIQASKFFKNDILDQYSIAMLRAVRFIHFEHGEEWNNIYSAGDYFCGIIVSLLSTVYCYFLVIYLSEIIVAENALTMKINYIRHQLKIYMKNKDLPKGLKKHLQRFYLHRFQAHYFSNKTILQKLTKTLRKEIGLYTSYRLLHGTDVFKTIPKDVTIRFVQKMHRELYFPNDVIIQGNTFGDCMYFISSGTVSVSTVFGKEICLLKDGDFFGEIAMFAQNRRRTANVTAVTIIEVYRVESLDFKKFIEENPSVYSKLEKTALERYNMISSMEIRES